LTDHDWLRSRLRTLVVLRLSLISLELIRVLATLSRNALLDPDIRFPTVPLRLSPKVAVPTALWLAAVALVNHGSRALRAFRFTQRLALDVSLDDAGAGSDVDGRAWARRWFEAIRCSLDVESISSTVAHFEECARRASLVFNRLDSAGRDAVSLYSAIAAAGARFTMAEGGAVVVGVVISISAPAIDDPFSCGDLWHCGCIGSCLLCGGLEALEAWGFVGVSNVRCDVSFVRRGKEVDQERWGSKLICT
jgi:hypothetical protein